MSKSIQLRTVAIFLPVVLLLVAIFGAYYTGIQHAKGDQQRILNDKHKAYEAYNAYRSEAEAKFNRLTSDYESACYNYQTLYAAYEELYRKAGVSSGLTHISRPDGAKGNEESCYR